MFKIFSFLFFFLFGIVNAQIHELGFLGGGVNYIGDVGPTTYISPNNLAIGGLYKWNKSPRLSYRLSLTGAFHSSTDSNSDDPSRNKRGYQFMGSLIEGSAGVEFNFFNFNLHSYQRKITPYIHTGINYLIYREGNLKSSGIIMGNRKGGFTIPMTIGIKSNVLPPFILAAEISARYAFTDNLDGSNPADKNLSRFGNLNNNDWYVFSGMTLTYTFGQKPCYCRQK